jgi:hypothetical protein
VSGVLERKGVKASWEKCPGKGVLREASWDESPRQAGLGELGPGGLRDRGGARTRAGRPRTKARRSLSGYWY